MTSASLYRGVRNPERSNVLRVFLLTHLDPEGSCWECMIGFGCYVVSQIIQSEAIGRQFAGPGHDTQTIR